MFAAPYNTVYQLLRSGGGGGGGNGNMNVSVELEPKHNEEMQSVCFSRLTNMKPLRSEAEISTCVERSPTRHK